MRQAHHNKHMKKRHCLRMYTETDIFIFITQQTFTHTNIHTHIHTHSLSITMTLSYSMCKKNLYTLACAPRLETAVRRTIVADLHLLQAQQELWLSLHRLACTHTSIGSSHWVHGHRQQDDAVARFPEIIWANEMCTGTRAIEQTTLCHAHGSLYPLQIPHPLALPDDISFTFTTTNVTATRDLSFPHPPSLTTIMGTTSALPICKVWKQALTTSDSTPIPKVDAAPVHTNGTPHLGGISLNRKTRAASSTSSLWITPRPICSAKISEARTRLCKVVRPLYEWKGLCSSASAWRLSFESNSMGNGDVETIWQEERRAERRRK